MPRKRPANDAESERKYFVPVPVKKSAPESPRSHNERVIAKAKAPVKANADAGAKYYARNTPLPSELSEVWNGKGPELPPGYDGGEACPDCSTFKGRKHAQLCIRNPLGSLDIGAAWQAVRTKVQIFFGTAHPIGKQDFDTYMTIDRQKKLRDASMIVMYDFPAGDSRVGRSLLGAGEIEQRAVIAEWKARRKK